MAERVQSSCFCVLSLLCALCIVASLPLVHAVDHVTYVDKGPIHPAYLFRGGKPFKATANGGETVDIAGLKVALHEAALRAHVNLPADFYIIDVALMNIAIDTENDAVMALYEFFRDHPQMGIFYYWETSGTHDSPTDARFMHHPNLLEYLGQKMPAWQGDLVEKHVDKLRDLVHVDEYHTPTVIYAHDDNGIDRTGEILGGYYLRYYHLSWADANAENTRLAGRPIRCPNYNAMQWFCLYLNSLESHAFGLDCLINQPCTQ